MKDKKFHALSIIVSVIAAILSFCGFAVEDVAAGIAGLIMAIKKKDNYRIKIPVIISLLAIIGGLLWITQFIILGVNGTGSVNYWLFVLIFGK